MLKFILFFLAAFNSLITYSQTPKTYTSSEILLQLKKLNVLGSVLYIAAHPDDENTRLLAYLASEKLYRTGYLSLTRGDGGQNLIGDEQGIDLGLIRTQELLSARRIDGAEQFFSRAYDFGFSKSSDEALKTWGHDKILSDVVWVIRKFRPDVIITRFPGDSRAGHGHHTASALLAAEAFDAAADPAQFPEQLTRGGTPWQARRLLWNTFNFGNTNTQSEDQFKMDVGAYNPLLGKGYGEIAALSRSQHKSQGFGVSAQRGAALEYFSPVKGDKPVNDLMEGVEMGWERAGDKEISASIQNIIKSYSAEQPERSIPNLVSLYQKVQNLADGYWKEQKLKEIKNSIEAASGLFLDATTNTHYAVEGDSVKVFLVANNRAGIQMGNVFAQISNTTYDLGTAGNNINLSVVHNYFIQPGNHSTQPYWLEKPMDKGSFNVEDQLLIGMAENQPMKVNFRVNMEGVDFVFSKPVRYKYTDPVRGEMYQPLIMIPVADVKFERDIYLFKEKDTMQVDLEITPNMDIPGEVQLHMVVEDKAGQTAHPKGQILKDLAIEKPVRLEIPLPRHIENGAGFSTIHASILQDNIHKATSNSYKRVISYDHIPSIVYRKEATAKTVYANYTIAGKIVGYIPGAGDKVPEALMEMGYKVVMLGEHDIYLKNLKQFDAIVTGVRAYNTNEWMNRAYDALMEYVKGGGILLTQYNTSNQFGPIKAKMAPYPFTISRNRVTDEEATVNFLLPSHPVLNYPNKITQRDFDGWIQERSIYNADKIDSKYQRIFSMKDPGEEEQDGSLIVANYGKGRFVYTGLVFFRELPAGVPGAYRLFANLIAVPETIKTSVKRSK